jgi:hypothetical protein
MLRNLSQHARTMLRQFLAEWLSPMPPSRPAPALHPDMIAALDAVAEAKARRDTRDTHAAVARARVVRIEQMRRARAAGLYSQPKVAAE